MDTTQNTSVEPKYLRAKGIAQRYSIGVTSVWRMVKAGKITPYKISPQTTLFKIDEVEKALFGDVA